MQLTPSTWEGITSWWKGWYHEYWEEGMALIPTLPDMPDWFNLERLDFVATGYHWKQIQTYDQDVPLSRENPVYDFDGEIGLHLYESIWHGFDSDENYLGLEQDQFGLLTRTLADNHPVYTNVSFYVDAGGRPLFTPCVSSQRNLSNPIDRFIDYMELAFYSQYAGSYEEAREKDPWIIASQVIMQVVQVTVGILASNMAAFAKAPEKFFLAYVEKGGTSAFLFDMGKEILEELVLEELISSTLSSAGVSAPIANLIGEAVGSFDAVENVINKIGQKNYADLYSFLQTHTPSTTAQHLPTSAQLSVKDFKKMKQVGQVAQLKATLQARSSIHALQQLRGNVDLMHTLQSFIAQKMDMNIHLKPYLLNLASMPIEKFTNHHMTEDAFRREVEETIWEYSMAGKSVQEFLSDKELLAKWGLTETQCEMYFKVSLKKWGVVEYRADGIVKVDKDGKQTLRYQYGGETLGYLLSTADSISFIDPPVSNGIEINGKVFAEHNVIMKDVFLSIKLWKDRNPGKIFFDIDAKTIEVITDAVIHYPNQGETFLKQLFHPARIDAWMEANFLSTGQLLGLSASFMVPTFNTQDSSWYRTLTPKELDTAKERQEYDELIDEICDSIIEEDIDMVLLGFSPAERRQKYLEYLDWIDLLLDSGTFLLHYQPFDDFLRYKSLVSPLGPPTSASIDPSTFSSYPYAYLPRFNMIRKNTGITYPMVDSAGRLLNIDNFVDSIPESYIAAYTHRPLDTDGSGGFFSRVVGNEVLGTGPLPFTSSRSTVRLKAPFYEAYTSKPIQIGRQLKIRKIKATDLQTFEYFGISVSCTASQSVPLDASGNIVQLYPKIKGHTLRLHTDGHSTMDIASAFSNPNDAWGFCVEHLGYKMIKPQDGTNYGVKKDTLAPRWIADGGIPIYTAEGSIYDYYMNRDPTYADVVAFQKQFGAAIPFVVEHIGTEAPLLDVSGRNDQYRRLMGALDRVSRGKIGSQNPLFEALMGDLSLDYKKYGFKEQQQAKDIQEAFGLILDASGNVIRIKADMQPWWDNVRAGKITSGMMYRMLTRLKPRDLHLNR